MNDLIPPNDTEAELAVLGSLLLVENATEAKPIFDTVTRGDFYRGPHCDVFDSMQDLWEGTGACDVILLRNDLQERGVLEKVGGTSFIGRLASSTPTAANGVHYARIVRKRALEREVLAAGVEHDVLTREHGNGMATQAFERLAKARAALDEFEHAPKAEVVAQDFAVTVDDPDPPAPPMFIDRLIVRDSLNIFFGPPASGKSWSMMSLGLDAVTTGGTLFGSEELRIRIPEDGREEVVLWIYGSEDNSARILRRLKKLHGKGDPNYPLRPGKFLYQTPPDGVLLHLEQGWRWLTALIEKYKPTVLVLDTIASLTAGLLNVRDEGEVLPFMQRLLRIRTKHRVTILAGHHTSKPAKDESRSTASKASSMLGSQAFLSLTEGCFMVEAKDGDTSNATFRCVKTKDVENPIPALRISLDRDTGRFQMLDEEEQAPAREVVTKKMGRPARDYATELEAIIAKEGYVHTSLIPKVLGIEPSTWGNHRVRVCNTLSDRGYVILEGQMKRVTS